MTVEMRGDVPYIKFTGDNGEEVIDEMTTRMGLAVEVNELFTGTGLSINQIWGEGDDQQIGWDRYRIPLNCLLNLTTGAVVNNDGDPVDYAVITELEPFTPPVIPVDPAGPPMPSVAI